MKKEKLFRHPTLIFFILLFIIVDLFTNYFTSTVLSKNRVELNKNRVEIYVGRTKTIKLKKAKKRVAWKVRNKKVVKIIKKSGAKKNNIQIKGLKKGKTTITAKCGKKKYVIKITVKKKVKKGNNNTQTVERPTKQPTTDITESILTTEEKKLEIIGKAINKTIRVGEDLEIEFHVSGNVEDKEIKYGLEPICLKKLINGVWIEVAYAKDFPGFIEPEYSIVGNGSSYLKVPLCNIYQDNSPGHYCYMHKVGDINISVEFDVE